MCIVCMHENATEEWPVQLRMEWYAIKVQLPTYLLFHGNNNSHKLLTGYQRNSILWEQSRINYKIPCKLVSFHGVFCLFIFAHLWHVFSKVQKYSNMHTMLSCRPAVPWFSNTALHGPIRQKPTHELPQIVKWSPWDKLGNSWFVLLYLNTCGKQTRQTASCPDLWPTQIFTMSCKATLTSTAVSSTATKPSTSCPARGKTSVWSLYGNIFY